VATAANWCAASPVTRLLLSLTDFVCEAGTFWLFGAMCVAAFRFGLPPATKRKTLPEIRQMRVLRAADRAARPDTRSPAPSLNTPGTPEVACPTSVRLDPCGLGLI